MQQGGFGRGPLPQHWHSIDTLNSGLVAPQAAPGALALSANVIVYTPLIVRGAVVVKKLWLSCGSTGGGNIAIGLYNAAGTKLLDSGTVTHPAAATEYVWDCTDTLLGPNIYYFAFNPQAASQQVYVLSLSAPIPDAFGVWTESGSSLPSSATFATGATVSVIGGILTNTVVS